jgi:DNA polymerase-3 subunit gamma/tau
VTYQSLYRKYRSQTFGDVVGQEAITRTLRGAIVSGRTSHAYVFSGTRGTGKTSTARLLAKALNCTGRAADDPEPCNECESCLAIGAGASLDLIEIDAASNRGIDEIRDLREKVNLAPSRAGGRKVYIIDEAHMLTAEAFNALLKTLEEPPEHVVFILCTTEANRIPPTVLGRCQQFQFRRFTDEQLVGRLRHIAEREGVQVEPGALVLAAHVAQGSMRDAIGLLDQLVPLADGTITEATARDLLGMVDPGRVGELLDLVLAGRAGEALAALSQTYEGGAELRQVVRGLMETCRDRLVGAIEARDASLRARLSTVLDGLLHLDGEVRRHAEPRFLVEATLVRLAVEVAPAEAAPPSSPAAVPEVSAPAPAAEAPAPAASAQAAPAPRGGDRPPAATQPAATQPAATQPPAPPRPQADPAAPAQPAAPAPAGADDDLAGGWKRVLEALPPKTRAYYREARPERSGSTLVLWFPYSFHHKQALDHVAEVEPRVKEWLGASTSLDLRLREQQQTASTPPRTHVAPEEDPVVQEAVRKLEGRVTRVREIRS